MGKKLNTVFTRLLQNLEPTIPLYPIHSFFWKEKIKPLRGSKDYSDSNYFLRRLFVTSKNEAILLIEQAYAYQGTTVGDIYHYDDIGIFKLGVKGDLIWTSKIKKEHAWHGTNKFLSFYSTLKNDRLFLFYNGNYINIEGRDNFLKGNDAALLCTTVESDGSFQRNVVSYYAEEYPVVAIPRLSNRSEFKGVLLYSVAPGNVKRQKFTNVTLN